MKEPSTYHKGKQKNLSRQYREREYNFLKYWRVVRHYIRKKYSITAAEHDMLLYLYDMPYFKKTDFNYYGKSMSWDKKRFIEMKRKGLVREWQRRGNEPSLFELTTLGRTICNVTYKKLMGEKISVDSKYNPVVKRESFSDKMYSQMIEKMNASRQNDNDQQLP